MPLVCCKCTNCGANIEVDKNLDAAICPFCNTAYIVEKAINNYYINTLNVVGNNVSEFIIHNGVLERYIGLSSKVVIPKEVLKVGKEAFMGNEKITSVVFERGPVEICQGAFKNCMYLSEVVFSDTVRIIGDYVFENCKSLTQIDFPPNLNSVGPFCFIGCSSLSKVVFYEPYDKSSIGNRQKEGWMKIDSFYRKACAIGVGAFENCTGLKEVYLSRNVKKIFGAAFKGCTGLIHIERLENIFEILYDAFEGCTSLRNIDFTGNKKLAIWSKVFKNCVNLENIVFSEDCELTIWGKAFVNCTSLTTLVLPKNTTFDGRLPFDGCTNLSNVQIHPDGMTKKNYINNFIGTPFYSKNKKGLFRFF